MRTLRCTLLAAGAVALLGLQVAPADEPKNEPKDDALPKGAKLRLGSDQFAYRYPPSSVLLPPDYKTLLISDTVNGFRRFDIVTGKALDDTKGGITSSGGVVVSGNGRRAVGMNTGILTVRDTTNGKTIQELKPPMGFTTFVSTTAPAVSFSGDGKLLAQGGPGRQGKGEVLIWDVDKNEVVAEITTDQRNGVLPVLSFDGKLLATRPPSIPFVPPGGKDDENNRSIRVWDVSEKKELFKAHVSPGAYQIHACAFSPDGSLLAASCADGPVDLWDVKTGKIKTTLLGRSGQGYRVAFSADNKTLAAAGLDGTIQRWSTETGKSLGATEPPAELPTYSTQGLAFADKDRVITWGATGSVLAAWDAPGGKLLTKVGEHTNGIKSIGFADGGKQIVTAGMDGKLVKWDATTGKALGPVTVRPPRVGAQVRPILTLAPDAGHGVSVGAPVSVFDLKSGAEMFAIPRTTIGGGFSTYTITSADAERVIVLSAPFAGQKNTNGTLVLWDLTTRKKVVELELPIISGFPPHAAVSPSGDRVVVARFAPNADGTRNTLKVTGYEVKTGKKLGEIEENTAFAQPFVAAADEKMGLVSTGNGRLRAFNYEEGKAGDEIEAGGRGEPGAGVAFSPDGKRFAFGVNTEDGFGVRIYDWPSGKAVHTFIGHKAPVSALTFAPDGKTLASGSQDTTVLLWDLSVLEKK